MSDVIRVRNLRKTFAVPVKNDRPGLLSGIRHFLRHPTESLTAVKDLSFAVKPGEVTGFLGTNGSGKSTTIKMLTGILTPTSGEVEVLGYVPHKERYRYTREIGLVLGQKSLLWWNIPVIESFKLYRDIYGLKARDFERRLHEFTEILEIRDYLHVPVRKLSLGLRMRAEIAASLLHKPRIVFLDEPTIGLDVLGRTSLKRFLKTINDELGITIFLTTHNMFDVEDLCRRVIILHRGALVYDGGVAALKEAERFKVLELEVLEVTDERRFHRVLRRCRVLENEGPAYKLRIPAAEAVAIIEEIFASSRPANLNVVPPTLESIIEKIFEPESGEGHQDVAKILKIAV